MTTYSPTSHTHGASRLLASRLVGCGLTNRKDAAVGTLEDMVFDRSTRHIAYVVVSFADSAGTGNKYFAMPWNLIEAVDLDAGQGVQATMNIARATLIAAPGFDQGNWPDVADARWATRLETHYRPGDVTESSDRFDDHGRKMIDASHDVARPFTSPDFAHRRLSQLIGIDVVDPQHRALASLEDLIVDVRRATVDGAVLALGNRHGSGGQHVLVPAEALHFDAEAEVLVLNSSRERLQGMAIPAGAWPVLHRDDWLLGSRERLLMAEPIPAPAAGTALAPIPATRSAPRATGFGGLAEQVRGTVVAMGSASKQRKGEPRLRLRLRTAEGSEVVVLAAAVDDKDQESLALRIGQLVDVRGWRASQGARSLLVAGSITVLGNTVHIAETPPDEISMPQ